MKALIVTDGSIVGGNPGGAGGWAFYLEAAGRSSIFSGFMMPEQTNNTSELMACIQGLATLRSRSTVELHTDSEYVMKGFTEGRVDKWAANNFMRRKKKPGNAHRGKVEAVPNRDLWMRLDSQAHFHEVEWRHVKGHVKESERSRIQQIQEVCHTFALRCARIAWEHHVRGIELKAVPQQAEAQGRLLEVARDAPNPPPPPDTVSDKVLWAVYRRANAREFYAQPEVTLTTARTCEDGGEEASRDIATRMNRMMWSNPATDKKKATVAGLPLFEALPLGSGSAKKSATREEAS